MKIFVSYKHDDEPQFTGLVVKELEKHWADQVFFDNKIPGGEKWKDSIGNAIRICPVMVVVIGKNWEAGSDQKKGTGLFDPENWVRKEIVTAIENRSYIIPVLVNGRSRLPLLKDLPEELHSLRDQQLIRLNLNKSGSVGGLVRSVKKGLTQYLNPEDGLPRNAHLFGYEKDIIGVYDSVSGGRAVAGDEELVQQGCPPKWPEVQKLGNGTKNNPLIDAFGSSRPHESYVLAKALFDKTPSENHEMVRFREAGPRDDLYYPTKGSDVLKVAIVVSGGIAPGINAVIDGIVRRHWEYSKNAYGRSRYKVVVDGLQNGFQAVEKPEGNVPVLPLFANWSHKEDRKDVRGGLITSEHVNEGGSIIGTARVDHLVAGDDRNDHLDAIAKYFRRNYNIVYIIGGDGSMRAAHAIYKTAEHQCKGNNNRPLSVVGIPKTMDNDVLWVWQSFGFMSAVDRAREFIDNLSTEAKSNPRVGLIQLFGSDSGYVVSHAVLASSTDLCYLALIPEVPFTMKEVVKYIRRRITESSSRQQIPSALIVLSETAIPMDAIEYLDEISPDPRRRKEKLIAHIGLTDEERTEIRSYCELRDRGGRIQGQTNDALRTGGLKIVSRTIEWELQNTKANDDDDMEWEKARIFTNEPRHLLRSIPPSPTDIITGQRLGSLAVDNSLAGYSDFMISQWLTEFVLIPLDLVVLGRKRIPPVGIFWKSVCAKTGQPNLE